MRMIRFIARIFPARRQWIYSTEGGTKYRANARTGERQIYTYDDWGNWWEPVS